ncbi:MAG: hypothetical protein IIC36_01055 [Gemmatimonadetes bacterium]|nr:hypothetical protein [Gemmatimonadota bacterium]
MTLKLRHMAVLFFALLLGSVAMYIEIAPWLRLLVAGFLLFPIIYAADGLGIAQLMNVLPQRRVRHRQFGVLRSEVMQLLDVVRRLNWLTVDLERGVRNKDAVTAEIAFAERRLGEILDEIRDAVGRSTNGEEVDDERDDERDEERVFDLDLG